MAKYIRKGTTVQMHNNTEEVIAYGDVVKISKRIGVAASNINPNEVGTLSIVGVYEIQAESTETLNIGDTVYFNESNNITTTIGDVVAGIAVEPKVSGTTTAIVKIG